MCLKGNNNLARYANFITMTCIVDHMKLLIPIVVSLLANSNLATKLFYIQSIIINDQPTLHENPNRV